MCSHNAPEQPHESGMTLVELIVVMVLIGIVSVMFSVLFNSSLTNYFSLQKEASSFTQISSQSARLTNVIRGTVDIETATDNELAIYAYFYPADTYVSHLRYYIATAPNGVKQLKADLTPMTANPPVGTKLTDNMRSFVVIDDLYVPAAGKLFEYKGGNDAPMAVPIIDRKAIRAIQVNLAVKTDTSEHSMSVKTSLRNRKTNL